MVEVTAVNKIIEKAHFHSETALAIVEAMDITIQSYNFVTVPTMELRFAALELSFEKRFAALERSIANLRSDGLKLYAGLVIVLFGALGGSHYWMVSREDLVQARTEQRFQQVDQRFQQVDQRFKQMDDHFTQVDIHLAQIDTHLAQIDAHLKQVDDRFQQMDAKLDEIRSLVIAQSRRRPPQ